MSWNMAESQLRPAGFQGSLTSPLLNKVTWKKAKKKPVSSVQAHPISPSLVTAASYSSEALPSSSAPLLPLTCGLESVLKSHISLGY